ncbi:hypothetical protein F2Q69_00002538 [Brassica cretica]|uniref:Uncharacterized protein n=1 Tax=Brassica cretica TaxID=69181 RepID=A0A8S9P536_BRACR|nr:hypothetical protein F2Q69_00002538 [Brassica cretica]
MEDLFGSPGLNSSVPQRRLFLATSTDSSPPKVMKGLMAKKCSKSKKEGKMSEDKVAMVKAFSSNKLDNEDQMKKQEKERPLRISRSWQPSLKSIAEGGSS